MVNWRKSVVLKKSFRYMMNVPRVYQKTLSSPDDYFSNPIILANSFPKSGTHLLIQILQAFPGMKDWGNFLASTPSLTFKEISEFKMCNRISGLAPGELVSAHLFYSQKIEKGLDDKNAVHFFIYRDPRDVVISEAHYLSFANKWHRLSKYFKQIDSMEERIQLSIKGFEPENAPLDYGNIKLRYDRYKNWINSRNVFPIKFEDLIGKDVEDKISDMVCFYSKRTNLDFDIQRCIENAFKNIDPKKSHTFREGKTSAWKQTFTHSHKTAFKEVAGDLLIELGYEKNYDW